MCGICGFVSRRDIRLTQLKKMNDTMYHRGPDDSGVVPAGEFVNVRITGVSDGDLTGEIEL